MGHPESYTALDIVARYKRMKGFCVLHPMGWDSFGLPAERAAMKTGEHPPRHHRPEHRPVQGAAAAPRLSYDWDREIRTSDVDYYRWTQWIFLKLHEQGLAYLADVPVNWCPARARCSPTRRSRTASTWRRRPGRAQGDAPVDAQDHRVRRRLVDDLEGLDWPSSVIQMQRTGSGAPWVPRSTLPWTATTPRSPCSPPVPTPSRRHLLCARARA